MSFTEAIRSALSKYSTFEGRARRSEFWYFTLFIALINFVVMTLALVCDCPEAGAVVVTVIALIMFLPNFAVTVRRLHDVNKSGWFIFVPLIPVVGSILFLVWQCSRGTLGSNRFGDDPIA